MMARQRQLLFPTKGVALLGAPEHEETRGLITLDDHTLLSGGGASDDALDSTVEAEIGKAGSHGGGSDDANNVSPRVVESLDRSEHAATSVSRPHTLRTHRDQVICNPSGGIRLECEWDVPNASRSAWYQIARLVGVCLGATATMIGAMQLSSSYWMISWMIFGLFAPIGWAFGKVWEHLQMILDHNCSVRFDIRSAGKKNSYLTDAFAVQLRRVALQTRGEAAIEKAECAVVGSEAWQVVLMPSAQNFHLRLVRGQHVRNITAVFIQGEVVYGGKSGLDSAVPIHVELKTAVISPWRFLTVAFARSPEAAAVAIKTEQRCAKEFLFEWLCCIYREYMLTTNGTVEVMELQEEYKDSPPAWCSVRQERSVAKEGKGRSHYSLNPWALRLKKEAEFAVMHGGKARTTLFVSGPKGSGKTIFVEWLAGELSLPIYYVDLRSPLVNDAILREAITAGKLRHNLPVLFHFDEFQSLIEEWAPVQKIEKNVQGNDRTGAAKTTTATNQRTATGGGLGFQEFAVALATATVAANQQQTGRSKVSIQGLQCMIEGISTPNNAIFVFTSSRTLPKLEDVVESHRHEWAGLLRRFPPETEIPSLDALTARAYLRNFLAAYLNTGWEQRSLRTGDTGSSWDAFEAAWCFDNGSVVFDMFAKYAEKNIRDAYITGLIAVRETQCRVCEGCEQAFIDIFFSPQAVVAWVTVYAGGLVAQQQVTAAAALPPAMVSPVAGARSTAHSVEEASTSDRGDPPSKSGESAEEEKSCAHHNEKDRGME